jgi:pyruvate dehydrogenase E1 component beta subunit
MPKNQITVAESLDNIFFNIFQKHKDVIMMGLGINDPKNIFNTTKKVCKSFPKRVFDVPVSENSITGIAIGCSFNKLRPILTHQRLDFSLLTFDQIINQAAKWFYMFDGKKSVPIVIRMIVGRGWGQGPQHSQSLHSFFSHIPGLKVVMPSNSENAASLMYASVLDPNPVIFIEHRWLHDLKFNFRSNLKIEKIGKAKIIKTGKDLTIISCSYLTVEMLRLFPYLSENKIDVELIDLQTISPLDHDTILKSVKKTKRVLVLDIGHSSFGISGEIISKISENLLEKLKYRPQRIALPDIPTPTSYFLAKKYYPNKFNICKKIFSMLGIKKKVSNLIVDKDKFSDQPFKEFTGPF